MRILLILSLFLFACAPETMPIERELAIYEAPNIDLPESIDEAVCGSWVATEQTPGGLGRNFVRVHCGQVGNHVWFDWSDEVGWCRKEGMIATVRDDGDGGLFDFEHTYPASAAGLVFHMELWNLRTSPTGWHVGGFGMTRADNGEEFSGAYIRCGDDSETVGECYQLRRRGPDYGWDRDVAGAPCVEAGWE